MIVQAVNGVFYKNPILGCEDWIMRWHDMEEEAELIIRGGNKVTAKQIVNTVLRGRWGIVNKKYTPIKEYNVFPPKWDKKIVSYNFQVKVINCIPKELVLVYDQKFDQDLLMEALNGIEVNGILKTGLLIFQWNYEPEEVKKIYKGSQKSFLFLGLTKNQVQRRIRDQLGVKNINQISTLVLLAASPLLSLHEK